MSISLHKGCWKKDSWRKRFQFKWYLSKSLVGYTVSRVYGYNQQNMAILSCRFLLWLSEYSSLKRKREKASRDGWGAGLGEREGEYMGGIKLRTWFPSQRMLKTLKEQVCHSFTHWDWELWENCPIGVQVSQNNCISPPNFNWLFFCNNYFLCTLCQVPL